MNIKYNSFSLLTLFLIITLPFYVLIKVFFEFQLGIPFFGLFIKEFILILLGLTLIFEFYKQKKLPQFELIDFLIFAYFVYGIGITLINNLGIPHIFYGGRYDFLFFGVFLLYRHGRQFLDISLKEILKIALFSLSSSLFLSIFIKFIIGEESLLLFGYQSYISNWTFIGGVPNYHGLEDSGIRRFQGILDGPNAMGFFLIVYSSILAHYHNKKYEFYHILIFIFLFWLVLITYSRSALLGIGTAIGFITLLHIKIIYRHYKKYFLGFLAGGIIILSVLGYIFQEKLYNAVIRPSSTAGHFARMEVGIDRFIEAPLGQGLAEAGPGFRSIYNGKITKEVEEYYIPESWFIQQLIEGGVIYFSLFIFILISMLLGLYKKSKPLFGGLIAILVMNIFLHIFEATYLSILLFIFIGLLLSKR